MKPPIKLFALISYCVFAPLANAASWQANDTATLQQALQQAKDNDVIQLNQGTYQGPWEITVPLTLNCSQGAVIDGQQHADAIRVKAPQVSIRGCRIINWGDNLTKMNAGIFVEKAASDILIEHNEFYGDTFGIWLDSPVNARVYHNRIEGNEAIRSQDRGNGIHLFATKGADVAYNEVWHTRDGIYIDTSNGNQLRNNELHHLRYGVHYMYSYRNEVSGNYTHHTRTGYALMQSKYLKVLNNRSEYDENYGILMNYITYSEISGNQIKHIQTGTSPTGSASINGAEGKALFIYNSPFNTLSNNLLQQSDLAIHVTAGSEDNEIYGNEFIANQQQVKYVSTRAQEWSKEGKGNYWSDYLGWDRNGDGIGDTHYEPNDGVDKVLWKYPAAKVLMNSPAIETLRWIQREFPVLKATGIKDSYPLMHPRPKESAQKGSDPKSTDKASTHSGTTEGDPA
ncbi:MAG: nitrous oxide reductase family maturation protein NosD [Hahellaceae bacterium]|nr:nitrous oxide reductase family maturation protein NosD [Hahellaceae bacterium]MCP5169663.1 nitrous oxide reductase family maturation protein NosD [Hahellaceae bacterium]